MNRDTCQALAALSGRVLLSSIFLLSAFNKITDWTGTAAGMATHHMQAVPFFLAAAISLEVLGGLSVLLGFFGRVGAVALIVYLIPVTLVYHNFWAVEAAQQQNQMIHLLKNVSIMGGLFVVAALGTDGWSVDRWMRLRRERARTAERSREPVMVG